MRLLEQIVWKFNSLRSPWAKEDPQWTCARFWRSCSGRTWRGISDGGDSFKLFCLSAPSVFWTCSQTSGSRQAWTRMFVSTTTFPPHAEVFTPTKCRSARTCSSPCPPSCSSSPLCNWSLPPSQITLSAHKSPKSQDAATSNCWGL